MGVLFALASWQLDWMGTDLSTAIPHGQNEDWDWQLTMYEVSRSSLLAHHQLPGWNPYTQGGVPLLANPESPFLYPPFLLVLFFGTHAGLKLWVLSHIWLMVAAFYWMGREMRLGPVAAHGAAVLTLTSAFVPEFVAYGHVMYLPLAWLALAWMARRRGSWRLAGLAMAMAFLAGGHHLVLYAGLLLLADSLFLLLHPRVSWMLGAWMLLNLLLLGCTWATWPMLLAGCAILARLLYESRIPSGLASAWKALRFMAFSGLLATLLVGPKLATMPALWERAERLAPQGVLAIADEYSPLRAWNVLTGAEERPSGHEGQNVLFSPVPLLLAFPGILLAMRRKPEVALTGLLFLNLGWAGATPVNFLQLLHRIPPLDHIRVVERYSLVWTLYLGWFMGFALEGCWRLGRWKWVVGPLATLALAWHLRTAAVESAWRYRIGPGQPHEIPPAGSFVQVDDELTNWEAVKANRGKPHCRTTAWLEDPGPVKAQGERGYVGEVFMLPREGGEPVQLEASITPNEISFQAPAGAKVVVNQNAFKGWFHDGKPAGSWKGLLSLDANEGTNILKYRPPGLLLGVSMAALGWLWLLAGALRYRPGLLPPRSRRE